MADQATRILSVQLDADKAINGIVRLNDAIEANNRQMALNKQAIQANNQAMRNGTKDTQQAAAENLQLAKSNEQLLVETKQLKDEKRGLQKEVQNEIRQQSELDGSLRALRAELSNLTKQYDSLSRAERETGAKGAELKQKINAVTTEIKSAEEGTQRYYRNVGNYQNAILSAIGLNGKFGQSIMGLVNSGGGFSGALSTMGSSVKAFGTTLMGLMANPVFLAIAGIAGVGMAFKWFYDYNEAIAEASRLTKEFTGLQGDDMVVLRDKIRATADVMDKDFKETLSTADALMANFHITGEEAMNIINKGFASGADVNGDMLQKLQQYAPTFHDAGIAADEMVAIISQTKSGIFTDQGLEAIKQGSARIREMSDSTREALQGIGIDADKMAQQLRDGQLSTFDAVKQVSAQLKTLPNDAKEVGEVMTAVFGRQGKFASQEMIESLATMSTSLDEVTAQTGEYGELLLENINTEEELNNVTSAVFDVTQKGWEEAKQKATIYAKKALVAVVKGLLDVVNWFIRLYNQSLIVRAGVQYIILAFKQLWNAVKFVVGVTITGFKNIGRMIGAFVTAFDKAWQMIKGIAEGIGGIFRGIANLSYDEIAAAVSKVGNAAANGATQIYNAFADAWKQGINDLKGNFEDFVSESVENVKTSLANINGRLNEVHLPVSSGGGDAYGDGVSNGSGNTGASRAKPTGGGGNSSSGNSSSGNKAATKKAATTGKSDAEKAEEERLKALQAALKKGKDLELKAREEEMRKTEEGIIKLYKEREDAINQEYAAISTKSTEEAEELMKAKEAVLNENVEQMSKDLQAFRDKQAKEQADATKKAQQEAEAMVQAMISGLPEGSYMQKEWQLEQLRMQMEAELAMYENNEQMKMAIQSKYGLQMQQIEQQFLQNQLEIQKQKFDAIAGVVGGIGQVLGEFGDESREMAILQKTLALGEIMIAQAVAIANAVKAGSNAITPWQMIAQIATSVTAVTVAMVQAFKALDQAKFATGGYIRGAGTGTSDSIPVRVSNGESIMNANTTAMFGGLLSSLNQLGGGVPIQVQQTAQNVRGEDMLARAFAKGVAMLPNPVVSVVDINNGQRQVQVMNERATL